MNVHNYSLLKWSKHDADRIDVSIHKEETKMRTIVLIAVAAACMWAGMTYPNTFSTDPADFNYGKWPQSWGPESAREAA